MEADIITLGYIVSVGVSDDTNFDTKIATKRYKKLPNEKIYEHPKALILLAFTETYRTVIHLDRVGVSGSSPLQIIQETPWSVRLQGVFIICSTSQFRYCFVS